MAVSTSNTGKPERTVRVPADDGLPDVAVRVPSFIPAGTQAELDATGEATNPFTGERIYKAKV